MSSWQEIDRLRKDGAVFRALARHLLDSPETLTERETDFLVSVSGLLKVDKFSVRQAEWLLGIRDGIQTVKVYRGFSVSALIQRCFEARNDLSEDDERWIVDLHATGLEAIRQRHAYRLMRLAAQLNLIEQDLLTS